MERNAEWRQRVLLTSDRHLDNPHSDLKMQRRHLEEALDTGAIVVDNGDLFDAMQGKMDPRASKKELKPSLIERPYLDALVDEAHDFLEPYRECLAVIGQGNHDTNIIKRYETSLTARLCHRLGVEQGGYRGFVRFQFADGHRKYSRLLHYFHGAGGGGPVTRGVISTARNAAILDGTDVVLTGHTHESWMVPIARMAVNQSGRFVKRTQFHVSSPGYKDEYTSLEGGWAIEKGLNPKIKGAWWMDFSWSKTDEDIKINFTNAD
jgi:hypothetical protein